MILAEATTWPDVAFLAVSLAVPILAFWIFMKHAKD